MPISHTHYHDNISDELAEELIGLYQSAYCVKEYFYLFKNTENINILAIYNNDVLVHLIFYSFSGSSANVLNELFGIKDKYLNYFADCVFKMHKNVNSIHLYNLNSEVIRCAFPFKVWRVLGDIIINLPDNTEKYLATLGKRTKKTIRYYGNKAQKKFEDFSFNIQERDRINPEIINRITELHRTRMRSMKISSVIDVSSENKILKLSRKYGFVSYIVMNNKIAGGAICFRVGNHCFGRVIAYDQDYNNYRTGTIIAYSTIQAMIEKGVEVFHMEYGENDFKYRLRGEKNNVYTVSLFRSKWHKMLGQLTLLRKYTLIIKSKNFLKYKIIDKLKFTFLSQ